MSRFKLNIFICALSAMCILAITPIRAMAAEEIIEEIITVSGSDAAEQEAAEETIVQEIILDNTELMEVISSCAQDLNVTIVTRTEDIICTLLFSAFMIAGCIAAFIIWRFKF